MNSKVTYIGSAPGLSIVDPQTGRQFQCKRGKPLELPTAVAGRLVYQAPDDWEVGAEVVEAAAARKAELDSLAAQAEADRKAREQAPDETEDVSAS